jgi:hypothetical protein
MTTSPLRSETLDLRLTPEAKQTLERAAAAAQRSVTDFVLDKRPGQSKGPRQPHLRGAGGGCRAGLPQPGGG